MTDALTGLRRLPLVVDDDAETGVVLDLRGDEAELHLDLVALEGQVGEAPDLGDGPEGAGAEGAAAAPAGGRTTTSPSASPEADAGSTAEAKVLPGRLRPSRVLPVVAATIVAALAVALTGSGDHGPGPGEAEMTVDGRALVIRADGRTEVVTGRADLSPGDRLDVEAGVAHLDLADDVVLEGVEGTSVVMGLLPVLRRGDLLVDAPATTAIDAGPAIVEVSSGSAARLARTYAVAVGVYDGSATVSSAGAERSVPARRAAGVAARGEIGSLRPIGYQQDDDWDRRYLADALALDRQIGPLAAGMRASSLDPSALLGRVRTEVADPPSPRQLAQLLDGRVVRLDTSIAVAVVGNGEGGTFASRWRAGLAFRDEGAPWGLVALDLAAAPEAVTASLRQALDQGPAVREVAAGPGLVDPAGPDPATDAVVGDETPARPGTEAAATGTATAGGPGAGPSGGGGTSGGAAGGGGGSTPSTTPPPSTPPAVAPPVTVPTVTVPPPVSTITDPVTGTVDELTGTLGGVLSPVVGGVVGTLQPGGLLPLLPGEDTDGSGGVLGGLLGR